MADSLPFLDVEHPATHEYLTAALADQLSGFGIAQLDVSAYKYCLPHNMYCLPHQHA